jgi:hypothetical protein
MIKASELRLGNWYSNGEKYYTLETSSFMDFLNEAQVNNGDVINAFPILLTPEIFKDIEELNRNQMLEAGCALGFQEGRYWVVHEYQRPGLMGICCVEYLHEFQNCFHALIGSDLEIKLTIRNDIRKKRKKG